MDKNEDFNLPLKTDDLIKELDKIYPEECANLKDTEKEIFYKSGQRSVVNFLKLKLSQSNNNILTRK
jgi:hypothetical protein|tara:strand:- start:1456 stop:1656 length:201 start_codon:yes stop_codon:yes gene_type:complete